MNKARIISTIVALLNVILSVLFLPIEVAFFTSGFSIGAALIFWFGYTEIGIYKMATGRNFYSDSQGRIIGWIVLFLILFFVSLLAVISIISGKTLAL